MRSCNCYRTGLEGKQNPLEQTEGAEALSTIDRRDQEPAHITYMSVIQVDAPASPVYSDAELSIQTDWLSLFAKLGANKFGVFTRQSDPWEAHKWINSVAETLDIMECPKEKRVKLAMFFLTGDAINWWKSTATTLGAASSSWEVFKELS